MLNCIYFKFALLCQFYVIIGGIQDHHIVFFYKFQFFFSILKKNYASFELITDISKRL